MTIGKGALTIGGFKKATTWNVPVALGAGDGIEFHKETIGGGAEAIEDQAISGSLSQREEDAGPRMFGGDIEIPMRYEGVELRMLAQVFGLAGAPSTVDTSAKKHVLKMGDLTGIFGTFAFNKLVKVHEWKTIKLLGVSLRITKGQRAVWTYRVAASDLDEASVTNTSVTMATITVPANREFALFNHLKVRINAQAGGALGGSNEVYIEELTLDIDRPQKTDDVTTRAGNLIDEPVMDGGWPVKVKGTIKLSKYGDGTGGNEALRSAADTKARQKMDIVLLGVGLAGAATQKYQASFFLPNIQFQKDGSVPNVSGPGVIAYSLSFNAYRVTTAPTGFTAGYTDPVVAELYNQTATDLLA